MPQKIVKTASEIANLEIHSGTKFEFQRTKWPEIAACLKNFYGKIWYANSTTIIYAFSISPSKIETKPL